MSNKIFASIILSVFASLCFVATKEVYAGYSSACGGSATDKCVLCSDRYVCDDNGSCGCQYDQYCADTACQNGESRLDIDLLNFENNIVPAKLRQSK